jgi:helix-turn-helix protein
VTCDVSYEDLAAFAAGDSAELAGHAAKCDVCRKRLDALSSADDALRRLPRPEPSASALLKVRRELAREVRPDTATPEVMTLDEVAAFLRVSADQLGDLAAELPAFELGGRIRVRRERLVKWIEVRERDYMRNSIASHAARTMAANGWKGVA